LEEEIMDHQTFAQLLGNYGEFIGAIAVVATLGYLALQIRQNTKSMDENRKAVVAQSARDIDLYLARFHLELAKDPELKRIALASLEEEIDNGDRGRVEEYETFCLAQALMQALQASYRHSELEVSQEHQQQYHLGIAKGQMHFPAWRHFWETQRHQLLLEPGFMKAVDDYSGPVAGGWRGGSR
jgi:hypothetical protein